MNQSSFLRMLPLSLIGVIPASALTIELDYTHDAAATDFFGTYATAKTALEKAASDISDVLDSTLGAISSTQSEGVTGTVNATSVTFDWKFSYTNPSTGGAEELTTFTSAADTIKIFVGARNLTGNTLGQGGPGGAGFSFSGGGFESDWVAAMAAAETASNNVFQRGGQAPILGNISGSSTLGATTANYSLNYGPVIGNLWFDDDTDNDADTDTTTELNNYWHFDHTTAVAAGKIDFYSVALHEILHAIGYGTGNTWDSYVTGTTWTGAEGIAAHGTGLGLIDSGGAHLATSISSTALDGGASQDVVMSPSISTGVRKTLTVLDLAILTDLNYSAVPEAGSFALWLGLAAVGLVGGRRRRV